MIRLNEMIPDGSSQPSHGLLPLPPPPPPGIPRLPGGLNWAPRCSPEEWTAWCRVRDGLDVSNDYFEVVQIEQEEEEVFDLVGVAEAEGWDQTELMYFVFEFGTKKGVQFCREYCEMKNSAGQEVQQAVCPEPTKEAKVRFLFRESGRLGVQVVDGGLTLEEWFAGREEENLGVGVDGYFTTVGGKMLNPRVEISRLGLSVLQEVIFHGRLKGGAGKGAGRVDSPNVGGVAVLVLHGAALLAYEDGVLQVWDPQVLGIWSSRARGSRRVGW